VLALLVQKLLVTICNFQGWEMCVTSELKEAAEVRQLKLNKHNFLSTSPFEQLASLSHTYTRFQTDSISFYFVLVPSKDFHLRPVETQHFQRSQPHDLPYRKLDVLIQSLLQDNDGVSLADIIGGSDISAEWGMEHLDL
jgi:hypothetical protein